MNPHRTTIPMTARPAVVLEIRPTNPRRSTTRWAALLFLGVTIAALWFFPRKIHGQEPTPTPDPAATPAAPPPTDESQVRYVMLDATKLFGVEPSPFTAQDSLFRTGVYPSARRLTISEGEAYFAFNRAPERWQSSSVMPNRIVVRIPTQATPSLKTIVFEGGGLGWKTASWNEEAIVKGDDTRTDYWAGRAWYYAQLRAVGLPGSAHFRTEYNNSWNQLSYAVQSQVTQNGQWPGQVGGVQWNDGNQFMNDWDESFSLLSGGRAIQENLQLDIVIQPADAAAPETVGLDTITGVTVEEIDWTPYLKDKPAPALDGLASMIPADNLAVFFSSFDAMSRLTHEAERIGNPLAGLAMNRKEDQQTRGKLETQLCLPLSTLAKILGPKMVTEMAFTAGDTALREGTDFALLMRVTNPEVIEGYLFTRHAAMLGEDKTVRVGEEKIGDATVRYAVNDRRSVSSYYVKLGDVVVVANSLPLVRRIAAAHLEKEASIATLDEFRFFRTRYPIGGENEDALILLTDAAIRKWTSPKWRIAQSRRIRAGAAMADLAEKHRDEILAGVRAPKAVTTAWIFTGPTEVMLEDDGPRHDEYGTPDFLTPVSELDFTTVTKEEADRYNQFRDRYQNRWTRFFDPIAVSAGAQDGLRLDVTIMPLIAGSDYREMIEFTRGGTLKANVGDIHDNTLVHAIWHLNPDGEFRREIEGIMSGSITGLDRPLKWMGDTLEVYADPNQFWNDYAASEDNVKWINDNWMHTPIAARVAVRNPLALAGFLSAGRNFIETSAPNMAQWSNREHSGTTYVRIGAAPGFVEGFEVFYLTLPDAFTVSLDEPMIKAAIDRAAPNKTAPADSQNAPTPATWIGGSASATVSPEAKQLIIQTLRKPLLARAREESFAALPILNEWKRLYPDKDPVAVHESIMGVRLECPGGKGYTWNEEKQSMESVVYGMPDSVTPNAPLPEILAGYGAMKFGVTFEDDGLRARIEAEKAEKE